MTLHGKSRLAVSTAAVLFACGWSAWAVDWAEAQINGTTPDIWGGAPRKVMFSSRE